MKKRIGKYLIIIGLFGLTYTAINYINNTDSFGFFGADVVISKGDPTGMIIGGAIALVGFLLQVSRA